MDSFAPFPTILGIMYAEFNATFGPKVIYDVPEGIMVASSSSSSTLPNLSASMLSNTSAGPPLSPIVTSMPSPVPATVNSPTPGTTSSSPTHEYDQTNHMASSNRVKVDFDSLSEYIIPKRELFNRLLIISTPKYRIIGFPVAVEGEKYQRNALLFNLCFILDGDADASAHETVVAKMARLLRLLEVRASMADHAISGLTHPHRWKASSCQIQKPRKCYLISWNTYWRV